LLSVFAYSAREQKTGTAMEDELDQRFPKLMLVACKHPTDEWIVASPTKPLTKDEAEKVVIAYQTIQELIARGSGPNGDLDD
jgi:hypothetical protein